MCRGQQLADLWVWELRDEAVSKHTFESSACKQCRFTESIMPRSAYAVHLNISEEPIYDVTFAAQSNAA